ncbi:unnamed protein product [Closterium sp. NIES-54]
MPHGSGTSTHILPFPMLPVFRSFPLECRPEQLRGSDAYELAATYRMALEAAGMAAGPGGGASASAGGAAAVAAQSAMTGSASEGTHGADRVVQGARGAEGPQGAQQGAHAAGGGEAGGGLQETPWEELTVAQMEQVRWEGRGFVPLSLPNFLPLIPSPSPQMLQETKRLIAASERAHICPHTGCPRKFATPGSLKDHLNEHSGQRPYQCSVHGCGERMATRQLLGRHVKKHECLHACAVPGCGKRFAFRERLVS